jgi:serine/threonine protein kinase
MSGETEIHPQMSDGAPETKISLSARHLVSLMLEVNPKNRITMAKVIAHPFLQKSKLKKLFNKT